MRDFRNLGAADYLRIWWRRKWYFVLTFVLVGAGSGIYAWKLPLVYKSEARIMVDTAPISEDVLRQTERPGSEERVTSIRQQVQSRSFLERAIVESQLFGVGTPGFSIEGTVTTLRNSTVVSSTGGNVVSLSFSARDPQFARDVATWISERLVAENQKDRRDRADNASRFLDDQLVLAKIDLDAQEKKLMNFKTEHYGQLPDQEGANLNILNSLRAQLAGADAALERAREQKNLLEVRAREQKRLGMLTRNLFNTRVTPTKTNEAVTPQPNPLAEQLAAKRAQLSEMAAKYTPRHPDVVRLAREVEDLEQQVRARAQKSAPSELTPLSQPPPPAAEPVRPEVASSGGDMTDVELRVEAEAANLEITKRQRERDEIQKQINTYQAKLQIAPELEEKFRSLMLEQEAAQTRYKSLQEKKFQASMASALEKKTYNESYRIIDVANLPIEASFPNRTHISLMGILAAFLLGMGASFGREYLDPTIGGEQEAVRVLALPVLVSIPSVPEVKSKRRLLGGKDAA